MFYWKAVNIANVSGQSKLTESQAISQLDDMLKKTIADQRATDVPDGAFLSGGIDSSTITAIMQSMGTQPINTFTIGFSENEYNEAEHAKALSNYLGTHHTELYVTPKDARDVITNLPNIYDEPFADVSQIPTLLLAKMTQQHVKVALTGDGGDEIFGGYNRHLMASKIRNNIHWVPSNVRNTIANTVTSITPRQWDLIWKLFPKGFQHPNIGEKLHKASKVLKSKNIDQAYLNLVMQERNPYSVLAEAPKNFVDVPSWTEKEMELLRLDSFTERMIFNDQIGYLNDDILCKADRQRCL